MTHRKPLIAGNWKMYKTPDEAAETAEQLVRNVGAVTDVDMMIAPTFVALAAVYTVIKNSQIALGAQTLYWEDEGAYTGEISAPMLKSVGCRYCIIGHSERRQYFGETDATVNKKSRPQSKRACARYFVWVKPKKSVNPDKRYPYLTNRLKKD